MKSLKHNQSHIRMFSQYLHKEEKEPATVEKYVRDVTKLMVYAKGRRIDKPLIMEYKTYLGSTYAVTSANSMLAAVNVFLRFIGRADCCVQQFKIQKSAFCPEEKELTKAEYVRLVNAAKSKGNERLALILQTVCGTGIRVSELSFITVEAVKAGQAVVRCKGKIRTVLIVKGLAKLLLCYARRQGITAGTLFVTRSGKPVERSNIWREMKGLCAAAGVDPNKVFPHNLRHLFARVFYGLEKDIAKLADVLGHSSINTTRIYIITTGTEHRQKMERMHLIL